MPLFSSDAERQRRENLKRLEDKRVRFAQQLEARGFRPERMLFCSREDGSYVALARWEGRFAMIEAPKLDSDADFTFDVQDAPRFEREDVYEKGTGLNGAFGFGTKGARGFNIYLINSDNLHVKMPVVFGRNSWLEASYRKNPLLKAKRRRGDANVMWDFTPIVSQDLSKIEARLDEYYLAGADSASARGGAPKLEPDQFYESLLRVIREEELDARTRVNFGYRAAAENCLSVVGHAPDDYEVAFYGEGGREAFREDHLSEARARERCLGCLRERKCG